MNSRIFPFITRSIFLISSLIAMSLTISAQQALALEDPNDAWFLEQIELAEALSSALVEETGGQADEPNPTNPCLIKVEELQGIIDLFECSENEQLTEEQLLAKIKKILKEILKRDLNLPSWIPGVDGLLDQIINSLFDNRGGIVIPDVLKPFMPAWILQYLEALNNSVQNIKALIKKLVETLGVDGKVPCSVIKDILISLLAADQNGDGCIDLDELVVWIFSQQMNGDYWKELLKLFGGIIKDILPGLCDILQERWGGIDICNFLLLLPAPEVSVITPAEEELYLLELNVILNRAE